MSTRERIDNIPRDTLLAPSRAGRIKVSGWSGKGSGFNAICKKPAVFSCVADQDRPEQVLAVAKTTSFL